MIVIDEISVDDSVMETRFACDLHACKGACCTFAGGRGALVRDDEVAEIERSYPVVKSLLPPEHIRVIEQYGLIDGAAGNYATQCVDGKACVFVYYDDGIAKCSFERAYFEKKLSWRKPISCHLFPIRIGRDGKEIHYEYFKECDPAISRGILENIPVAAFASDSLRRAFGDNWTDDLLKQTEQR
ncbi:MAG: DUF3109 family protein [Ignavibacteriales bacterium]|nr:DUF3109 family protein [Ignavibacteriales bacterium]